ncbi:Oligoxyloglucan reducing end-specific cellobiohydrolase [Neocallimastix californiae]|uniref:Oligoxyloglucan reducing end-specific cellobiohydrolase n=1 Tax=Neocallimastix californiae TaxID=1754190 RepID=A0A1Y2EQJ6_9FUNG|nr:Oligoxyloglucan reducing end-specific cellobiohydrolase [Neocallimastix californiae]|eukprot:ORY73564.1 Oligoxyloglucan reducing end-specific cellobiohydrolase [Neocallimastix californiae]
MLNIHFLILLSTLCITFSSAYQWKNAEIVGGGFIPGIIFSEAEKDLIYARTDIGGLYRMNKSTKRWENLLKWVGVDNWNYGGVDTMCADPIDSNRVYAAVGMYTNDWDQNNGAIISSNDHGDTWSITELPFKVGGNDPGRGMGERIAVDPNDNKILFFGARAGKGLWKSIDYAKTWSQVKSFTNVGKYSPSPEYFPAAIGISFVTFDKYSGNKGSPTPNIYVGVADNSTSTVYVSKDAGVSWTPIPDQPAHYFPHKGKITKDGMLYITYSDGCGPYDGQAGAIYRYNTKTGEWKDISPHQEPYFGYGGLAIDAQNQKNIVVATLNSWWPDAILFRSTDGGDTWSHIWEWDGYPNRKLKYEIDASISPWIEDDTKQIPEPTTKLGWMIESLEIDPFNSDRIMWGTGATIWGSEDLTNWDNGQTFHISVMASGIEETAILDLVSPATGEAHLMSVMYDIGGFMHTDLDTCPKTQFRTPNFSSGNSIDYAENVPNFWVRVGTEPYIAYSWGSGSSWYAGHAPNGVTEGGLVAVGAEGDVLWAPKPYELGVFYGKESFQSSKGIPGGARICSDRVNGKIFYGYLGDTFYRSTDTGATFTKMYTGLPEIETGFAKNIKAVADHEGDVWLAANKGGLFHTEDGGKTFTQINGITIANTIGFGKAADGSDYPALYITGKIGDVNGIFRSDDKGQNWVRINDDKNQYGTINFCITGDPRIYGRVYVCTNGFGIVYGDIDDNAGTPIQGVNTESNEKGNKNNKNNDENNNNTDNSTCWSEILGYSCCHTTCTSVEDDADGSWGIEGNEWCGIPKNCESYMVSDAAKKCTGALGYPCCTYQCSILYTDEDGDWSVENDDWCLIDKSIC